VLSCQVARENLQVANELHAQKLAADAAVERVRVSVTSAASPLGRHVISAIASGRVFGPARRVNLTVCDTDASALSAVVADLAAGSVDAAAAAAATSDPAQFFADADVVLLLDDVAAAAGERRADWLRRVYDRFAAHARHVGAADGDAVVVVPALNSAASVAGAALSRCGRRVVVVPRLVEDLAAAAVSRRAGGGAVADLVVWGDASAATPRRFALDVGRAKVVDCQSSAVWGPQHCRAVEQVVLDRRWLRRDLPAIVSSSSSSSSVVSVATALTSFLSDWWTGSCSSQRLHSVAVASQGH